MSISEWIRSVDVFWVDDRQSCLVTLSDGYEIESGDPEVARLAVESVRAIGRRDYAEADRLFLECMCCVDPTYR